MHTKLVGLVVAVIAALGYASPALAQDLPPAGPQCDGSTGDWSARVLLFTEGTNAPTAAVDGVCTAAASEQIAVSLATTSDAFTTPILGGYDAVAFLSNAGDVLTDTEQQVLEGFIADGNGYIGIHRAAGAETGWAWYGDLAGARVQNAGTQEAMRVEAMDNVHPSTEPLANPWNRTDIWPTFSNGPRGNAHVLAQLDRVPPYSGAQPALDDRPIAWCQAFDGGRSWYTGMGGTAASYADPAFRSHLGGGIAYAAGAEAGDCAATLSSSFDKVQLDRGLQMGEVMELAVLPDERVLYTNRGTGGTTGSAQVRIYKPSTQDTSVAATIPVDQRFEDGLLGITLDPDFATTHWVFLYYSAQGEPLRQRLSRFTLVGDQLDMDSEKVILEFPTQRDLCCHSAGSMDWDSDGNLYLAVGDNTNSMASDGMVPIDERPERNSQFDAQRTAGNTNDLRGKILRINPLETPGDTPGVGTTYTVPVDNLFPEFEDLENKTRPEIFIMGVRNPFRLSVDERTNTLFWGEVGPDAGSAIPNRGPAAFDEWNRATEAGNYGWPYCGGPNVAYNDYDFATGQSGPLFPCGGAGGPVNDSPNNTGLQQLPPTKPSTLWELKSGHPDWPEFGTACCSAAFGGEIYDPDNFPAESEVKFPRYYEDHWFIYEWQREWMKEVTFDDEGPSTGAPLEPSPWLPDVRWWRPMDVEFGPQGNLYLLEYADGYFSGSPNAALYRIDYVAGERSPVARVDIDKDSGPTPLTVAFSGERSSDANGDPLTYEWDFTNDGTVDATGPEATHTYNQPGAYTAKLTVRDDTGRSGFENVQIVAGNTRPEVSSTAPVENGIFDWGDEVAFAFSATDFEDGAVPCTDMEVTSAIVHAGHTHQGETLDRCDGTLTIGEHDEDPGARFGYVIDGSYTDDGGAGGAPETRTVTGSGTSWAPDELTISVGDTVRWENQEGFHDIVVEGTALNQPGSPDSPEWNPPPQRTFASPGTFSFLCRVHAGMDGTITVEPEGSAPPLTGRKTISLYPHRWQAEHLEAIEGAAVISSAGAAGGQRIGSIEHGSWVEFGERDLENIASVTHRVSSGGEGGAIELHADSPTGPLISTATVEDTGGFDTYELVTAPVTDPGGSHKLFMVFTNADAGEEDALLDIDWFEFNGKGVAVNGRPYGASATATPTTGPAPLQVQFEAEATDPEDDPLTYTWDFGDGQTGTGQTVSHTYTQAGNYNAEVTIADARGSTTATVEVAAFAPGTCLRTEAGYCVLDLGGHYTNDGISEQDDFDDGNFDDAGWAFAADTMPPAGPFTSGDVPFQFPSYGPGETNSVEANGQALPLARGKYDEVKLLASAHHGNPSATATVNYADGTSQNVTLALTDWAAQTPAFGETVAIAADHRHSQNGDTSPPVNIWVQTLTIDGEREAESITLPDEDRIHLFAVSLKEAVPVDCTITGTDAGETLTGTGGADVICAGGGDDVVEGLGGDDLLRGGDGDDRLVGGDGNDTCAGGAGTDTARECESQSGTSTLDLDPANASTYTDETHDVTASFAGDDPAPPAGTPVRFELSRDGTLVDTEVVPSDAEGTATFSYEHGAPAEDTIVACAGADSCDDAPWRATAANTIVAPPELEADYDLLFDGTSLDGWQQAGPGEFRVEDGSMVTYGGLGMLWYAAQEYEDFSLKLSWKLTGETNNSGVFVRFPNPGNDPGVAINNGYEIQIYDGETGEPQKTGSIYNFKREEQRNSNPIGHWNDYEIRAEGHQYTVILNGEVVNTFTGSRNLKGFLGLQNHDPDSHVHFRYVRIKDLGATEPPATVFDTIGLADDAHKQNGQIFGQPYPYSLPAEELPESGAVVVPEGDDHDDVPVRMPDTSGAVPNLAGMHGQTFTLAEAERGAYDTMHVFGLATDVGQGRGSGTFTLEYGDGSSQQVTVALQDWGYPGAETADHHIGIGPIPYRYNTQGRDGAPVPFHIYHAVVPIAAAQQLESITFPSATTPPTGGSYPFAALYVMGLTFETAGGQFVPTDLTGSEDEDTTAPVTTAQADDQPDGSVRVTLTATDEEGGSGVARTNYRVDGGEWTPYSEPFTVSEPGDHTVEYWSVDEAGNEEAVKSLELTIEEPTDPDAPSAEAFADPSSGAAPLLVQFSATGLDPQGGVLTYEWDFGDGGGSFNQSPQHTYTAPGTYTATVAVTDPQGKTGSDAVEIVVTAQGNQAPVVRATSDPRSGVAPLKVSFSAQASDPDGPVSEITYLWDFGDGGANAFGRNAEHTYREPGTYTATVTATDRKGAFDTAEVVVTVADPPGNVPPVVQAAATPRSGAAPLRVSFTSAATDPDGDQVSTVWDFGDGVRAGGADIAHTYTAPGTYTATVTVRDPGGLTDTDSVQITVTGTSGAGAAPLQGLQSPELGAQERTSGPRVQAPRALNVRRVIRRGLRLAVSCVDSCRARSVLRISGERIGASKRLHIRAGGSRTVVVRLDRSVRRNLVAAMRQAGVRRLTATAVTTIATANLTRALSARVTLRR